jgi:hypothetical protein
VLCIWCNNEGWVLLFFFILPSSHSSCQLCCLKWFKYWNTDWNSSDFWMTLPWNVVCPFWLWLKMTTRETKELSARNLTSSSYSPSSFFVLLHTSFRAFDSMMMTFFLSPELMQWFLRVTSQGRVRKRVKCNCKRRKGSPMKRGSRD